MQIRAVLFDFIGTTVMEKDPMTISQCFALAFKDHGVTVTDEFIKTNRGKDKREVIAAALAAFNYPVSLIDPVIDSLKGHIDNHLHNFYENKGIRETIQYLKGKKIIIGLGTGLPRDTFERIFYHLGWGSIGFDYTGIAAETGKGRPHPDMILDMLKKYDLRPDQFLKVGDTVADIQEGKNAKVFTAAILSGTQDEQELIRQKPDMVIHSLTQLKEIL